MRHMLKQTETLTYGGQTDKDDLLETPESKR